ncbi:MFS transporter, partial [Streptomyces sp. SID7499]|nr:MFS transporter [Streptomyces sp. SID7499]
APVAAAAGALFFAVSFVSLRRIRRPESVPEHVAPVPERPKHVAPVPERPDHLVPVPERPDHAAPVRGRIREGLRFVAGNACLRAVCLASAAFQLSFAATMTVYLLFLPRELHLTGATVGLALAATGPGALLGSVL